MHSLSHIQVNNFRSCADVSVPLAAFCPIIGQNNCGKSTILTAIAWLLRPHPLQSADFGNPGAEVRVEGTIIGLTESHLNGLAQEHRNRITPYCVDGVLQIRRVQTSPGGGVRGIVLQIRDPRVEDEADGNAWRANPTGIDAAIQALFPDPIRVPAMQDAASDVTSGKKESTIGKLIASLVESLETSHGAHLLTALNDVRKRLSATGSERAPELATVDAGANTNLRDIFPGITVRMHFEPPTIADLFKSGTVRVFEGETERDVDQLDHGAQRAIQMALIRHLATVSLPASGATRTLLLIDEPELYLHPHAIEQVRLALVSLSTAGYQVIFSTHSPLLIGLDDACSAVMVHRPSGSGTLVRKRVAEAWSEAVDEAPSQSRRLFELGTASKVLFASRVVIAEGETEQRLLPVLYEVVRRRTMMAAGIALIHTGGGGGVAKCMRLLRALDIPCVAIVDLDYVFRQGPRSGLVALEDPDVLAVRALASELKDAYGFAIAPDGFPTKGGSMAAAEAFSCIAKDNRAKQHIRALANRIRPAGVWLWEHGAIEEHIGIVGKGEDVWAQYLDTLRTTPADDAISDYVGVNRLLEWIDGSGPASVSGPAQSVA